MDRGVGAGREWGRVERLVAGAIRLVPGARDLAEQHEKAIPQKDQLCGPFWGALTLAAAGHPADQDEVALRAGTTLAEGDPAEWLPPGASPRTDYVLPLPVSPDESSSGTSASGLARSIEALSENALRVVPVAGPWTAESVVSLVEVVASGVLECSLVANLRTGCLWGSKPPARHLLNYLLGLPVEVPAPDWDCGHFLAIVASLSGPGGALVVLRDTYAELGWGGYHLQPAGAVAAALERGDGHEGGVLCVLEPAGAEALARGLEGAGFELRHWDNGTPDGGAG
jgi:hypothetical protein